ncbi:MAG: hypothetical protein V2J25_07475 [Desulfatiglans sp.]|jgi:hypothetical protein|nr:hypothetical protein [Thermodesulfobacteriota bacterium]MEE4352698.1 hypothetical protein [Desulfatiglans sp.]
MNHAFTHYTDRFREDFTDDLMTTSILDESIIDYRGVDKWRP